MFTLFSAMAHFIFIKQAICLALEHDWFLFLLLQDTHDMYMDRQLNDQVSIKMIRARMCINIQAINSLCLLLWLKVARVIADIVRCIFKDAIPSWTAFKLASSAKLWTCMWTVHYTCGKGGVGILENNHQIKGTI